jgi:serine/threonine protein kinase
MYLSPEAITTPEAVDKRTDIYALGAVAYFLLTGHDVFSGETVVEVLSRHTLQEPQPPSIHLARPLPSDVEQLVPNASLEIPLSGHLPPRRCALPCSLARTRHFTIEPSLFPGGASSGKKRRPRARPARDPPRPWPLTSAGGRPSDRGDTPRLAAESYERIDRSTLHLETFRPVRSSESGTRMSEGTPSAATSAVRGHGNSVVSRMASSCSTR